MLDRLAKKLRAARFKNGAVKFDREELHFDVDEKGKPVRCYFKRSKDANKLIEEFMLLANRTVLNRWARWQRARSRRRCLIVCTTTPTRQSSRRCASSW